MKTTIQNLILLTLMLNLQFTLLNMPTAMALAQAPDIEWAKTYGGSGQDWGRSIKQTADGGYIVAGNSNSNDGDVSGNNGNRDFWVVKLESTLSVLDNTLPTVSLYPNPVKDILYLKAENPIDHIGLYTLTGQRVLWKEPATPNTQLDLGHLPKGVFLLDVKVYGHTERYKVIKQ